MENRFGVRDLIQVVLLLAIIVAIGVSMFQSDRQWKVMQQLKADMSEQTQYAAQLFKAQQEQARNPQILDLKEELSKLRKTLERGVVVAGTTPAKPEDTNNPSTDLNASNNNTAANNTTANNNDGNNQTATKEIVWGPVVGADVDPFERINDAKKIKGYNTGDYIVDIFGVTPDKLTPLISTDVYGSMVQGQILQSLGARDPDTLEWKPLVAKSWRISEDGLNMEFELRENVNFSDSVQLTADDVVFTFNWIMNPKVETPRLKSYYSKIASVTKLSKYRVRFTYTEPYFQAFELAAGMDILPKHFYEQYSPEEFNRSTGLLMGSGPYRLENAATWRPEPGKPIEVYRNERYWGPTAPFDRIIWRVIKEDSTRLTAFRNGEIDMLYPTPEQYIAMGKDKKLAQTTQHFEVQRPTAGYIYVGWAQKKNGKPTIFSDVRVRQAMTMLINREAICDDIFYGYASPITGPFSPMTPQSDKSIKLWPFDIQKAKALLAEAGYKDMNGDGVLDGPDGKPMSFKLSYPSGSETFNRVVLFIKDNFARAGVLVNEDPLEWNVLLQRMDQRDLEAYSLGWSGSIEGDPFQIFHSSMIEGTGDNVTSYSNPKLDKLIEEARGTVDEDKRMKLWHQVHQVLHEDQPYTFLMTRKSLIYADKRIMNVKPVATGVSPQIEWFVPASQIKWDK